MGRLAGTFWSIVHSLCCLEIWEAQVLKKPSCSWTIAVWSFGKQHSHAFSLGSKALGRKCIQTTRVTIASWSYGKQICSTISCLYYILKFLEAQVWKKRRSSLRLKLWEGNVFKSVRFHCLWKLWEATVLKQLWLSKLVEVLESKRIYKHIVLYIAALSSGKQ